MNNEDYKRYNEKRHGIIKEYKKKKLLNSLVILLVGIVSVIISVLLFQTNVAVPIVLSVIIVMVTIIYLRIRIVTINHTMQTKLRFFEQEEPTFHVNFKK